MSAMPQMPPASKISYKDEPRPPGPELWVLRLDSNQEITVTVLGTRVRGVETHWVKGKTQPHYDDHTICPGCLSQVRIDWKGYLHCYWWERSKEIFLELTPGSKHALNAQVGDTSDLRGTVMKCKRKGARNQPISVTINAHTRREKNLPEEKDPLPSILKLWGLDLNGHDKEPLPPEEPLYEEALQKPPDEL